MNWHAGVRCCACPAPINIVCLVPTLRTFVLARGRALLCVCCACPARHVLVSGMGFWVWGSGFRVQVVRVRCCACPMGHCACACALLCLSHAFRLCVCVVVPVPDKRWWRSFMHGCAHIRAVMRLSAFTHTHPNACVQSRRAHTQDTETEKRREEDSQRSITVVGQRPKP